MYEKNCCFFGHRKIERTNELENKLHEIIESLIVEKDVNCFIFGSKSQFNNLCYEVVTELKEKYPYIKRIYVRAEFPYIDENYKNYLLKYYEDTYYPEKILGAGRSVYVERNYEMIDNSRFCVVYYDKNYIPSGRKSGTHLAYEYAFKKGIEIINALDYWK